MKLTDNTRDVEGANASAFVARLSDGAVDVFLERLRQIEQEGFTTEHDDAHMCGSLSQAGSCYAEFGSHQIRHGGAALNQLPPAFWPWESRAWKPKDTRRNLVRAAALIIAEIDRLDRQEALDAEIDRLDRREATDA